MLCMSFFAGILLVYLNAEIYDVSEKRVSILQLISCFRIGAQLLYVPLGTYLSGSMATEWIMIYATIILLISVIPLFLMNWIRKKSK